MDQLKPSGYLAEDYRIFYNKDAGARSFSLHYHTFHKILLFKRGNVSYELEGRRYDLQPGDIVLVRAGRIHRPVIHDDQIYERTVLYISPSFFTDLQQKGIDLEQCFLQEDQTPKDLLRPKEGSSDLPQIHNALARLAADRDFAADLYRRVKLTELLIQLNREKSRADTMIGAAISNPHILKTMEYIDAHLTDPELSVDTLAQALSLNRSYLMHLFRKETGTTIGGFLTEKRLFLADSLIASGTSVSEAGWKSGFGSYSAFYHAWRVRHKTSPGKQKALPDRSTSE